MSEPEAWRKEKYVCASCDEHLLGMQLLSAPNPFDAEDTITGCPVCKAVSDTWLACDEPDCWNQATCGTPSPAGYRHVCGQHYRQIDLASQIDVKVDQ